MYLNVEKLQILEKEQRKLLLSKINELSLTVKGSSLETFIVRIYQELETVGIAFKPKTYLTDEWGCPNKVPVIGIPFYLADPTLSHLIMENTDQSDRILWKH